MPTFLAGLIAQPESDGGAWRMPVLLVRVRHGLCQHGSRSYQAGECGLLGTIQPFQGFIRDRHHRVLPSLLESGPLAARPSLATDFPLL